MTDITWLAQEAKNIHQIFDSIFYALVTVFILLGVFLEYFKWPLGGVPSFATLIGRALVAAIMLHTLPEVMNWLADITDAISNQLGDLNQFKHILTRMGEKLDQFTWSWVSLKDTMVMAISFIGFFALYFSVHICEAVLLYTWTMLYVFSPLLAALYVLPATSGATKALYQSLIEVSCWKIAWSVIATLLWSAALSDINQPGNDINWLTAITYNLILAGSLLLTPVVVHALSKSGLAGLSRTVGGVAVGATVFSPGRVVAAARGALGRTTHAIRNAHTGRRQLQTNQRPKTQKAKPAPAQPVSGTRTYELTQEGKRANSKPIEIEKPQTPKPPTPKKSV